MSSGERTALAAIEAPEHAAPTTPHTPAETRSLAAVVPVAGTPYPSHPESAVMSSNWTPLCSLWR